MDEAAALFGIPGKLDTTGADVLVLYEAGEMAAIHVYCQHDVLTTAWIYARMAISRGWWSPAQANQWEASVPAFLDHHQGTHWDTFRARIS